MANQRMQAYYDVLHRTPKPIDFNGKISELYGENVFHSEVMREYLPAEAYKSMKQAVYQGTRLDRSMADQVASAMKDWAITKGATHYTHWFQPLTGATAEKHDAFFKPIGPGRAIEQFDGDLLVQQEPDASSFPNGGIRNTFEARGYTAWDPSSPAFVIDKTLCIPTIFIAYTGEALDYKMPLLKALQAVNNSAVDVCRYFDKNVDKVTATLGWEQEYFLVDKALFNARPDLMMTGRALFGHASAKGQQLDDHYFGSISERATAFMREFETECIRLGIPVTTRHNEVAPNQFECAPMFEECNLANDHNLLLMDLMEKIARKHDFRVLLHEKPFAGVNGSGKHNNWSLFEFRAVGSSANCSSAMIVLNTIMAKQLQLFKTSVDARIKKGDSKDEAILKELQKLIKESKKIRFEGNGYGEEWVKEAKKRGLSNLKDTPRALQVWSDKKVADLFDEMGVLTPRELEARQEIEFENYVMKIQIEARVINEMVRNFVIPAAVEYQNRLISNVQGLQDVLGKTEGKVAAASQVETIKSIAFHMTGMQQASDVMLVARKKANQIEDFEKRAVAYCDDVRVHFDKIRYHVDKLELLIDDEEWRLPKFREMLFTR